MHRVKFYFSSGHIESFFVFDKFFRTLCFIKWVAIFTCNFCFVIDLKTCQFIFYILKVFKVIALFVRRVHLFVWN